MAAAVVAVQRLVHVRRRFGLAIVTFPRPGCPDTVKGDPPVASRVPTPPPIDTFSVGQLPRNVTVVVRAAANRTTSLCSLLVSAP